MRKKLMLMILLSFLSISTLGCADYNSVMPCAPQPAKPTFKSVWINDQGGICLDRDDTAKLNDYLIDLESR